MGQKVNPISIRLGVNRTWDSRWYAEGKDYSKLLHEDFEIREYIKSKLKQAGISKVIIEAPCQAPPRFYLCRAPWRDHRQERRGH